MHRFFQHPQRIEFRMIMHKWRIFVQRKGFFLSLSYR